MEFGIGYFPTHDGLRPGELARLLEQRGHAALFFAEHTHIPASRETPWNGGRRLPRKYAHTYDLFVALTAAAEATSRLRIGSGVCLVVQRDPIVLAKEVASVDHLSGGRFEFGVGAGWNREEMRHHGTDPRVRLRVLRERILAMKQIWTEEEASFSGSYVNFERVWSWPKPAQSPHPPVFIGSGGPTAVDRVLEYGDGWFPQWHDENVAERIGELRQRAGRRVPVQMLSVPPDPKALERLAEAGVDRASVWLPSGPWSVVEPALAKWEAAIGDLTGR